MQIIGLPLLAFIIWFGFSERDTSQISAFDLHAAVMVLVGSAAAILTSSSRVTALRTLTCLRELFPTSGKLNSNTEEMENQRQKITQLWRDGERAQAVALAEGSTFAPVSNMITLVLSRAPQAATSNTFLALSHKEMTRWQPAIANWELLAKLGPSFGMVGTITGMIKMFQSMGSENMNLGSSMSLALLATLYGVAFGAGVAGPIGHYLRTLLDERLGALERCEHSVAELIARSATDAAPSPLANRTHQ